ncbi:DUF4402 domain-containing protein [Salinimicrobium xinjiangense]|uniref:DUF4402 domain-containing protein n=1 Tax=Salinimicrobium xinjiangense TaxID=438596 RepID=UPI000429DE85|nr:DUF4402 domain-containing protein [Salinimicrobium xinjiangense]
MRVILTFLFIVFVFWSGRAQATASFTASATIIQPIGIKTLANLNFAAIDARDGGEIILSPQNERIAAGDARLENGGEVTAATFEVTGQQGFDFSLSLPSGPFFLSNGKEQMIIKDFTSSIRNTGNFAAGSSVFKIGATLQVEAQQAPGVYFTSTPLTITVNYN